MCHASGGFRRPVTAEARVLSQVNPCEICGEESDTGTDLYTSISVFPRQYNSTSVALSTKNYSLVNWKAVDGRKACES